jgi:hypothetical protein
MLMLKTRVRVAKDGVLRVRIPTELPPGDHEAVIVLSAPEAPKQGFQLVEFPIDSGPWDDDISLRREDLYGDNGR